MLIDHNVNVRFGGVTLRVGKSETLHLTTAEGDRAWDSPVHVSEPAHATTKARKAMRMSLKQIRDAAVVE